MGVVCILHIIPSILYRGLGGLLQFQRPYILHTRYYAFGLPPQTVAGLRVLGLYLENAQVDPRVLTTFVSVLLFLVVILAY